MPAPLASGRTCEAAQVLVGGEHVGGLPGRGHLSDEWESPPQRLPARARANQSLVKGDVRLRGAGPFAARGLVARGRRDWRSRLWSGRKGGAWRRARRAQ